MMGTWVKSIHRSATMSYWLGEWKVGGVLHEGALYKVFCSLPGSNLKASHLTEGDAQRAVEKEVEYWITKAGLNHELNVL